jgi:hypothetical protein
MKPKLFLCLALAALQLTAQARGVRLWSEAELRNASDLVVVASAIETKVLDETNALGWPGTASFQPKFRGVETTFKILNVLKGMPVNDRIVLHHYRYEDEREIILSDGPTFITFAPHDTNQYELYLVNDGANRFAPVAGQIDPGLSVRPPPTNSFGFPVLPPIADANPAVRHSIPIRVPTRLKIERTADTLSVEIDTNGFESTNLIVGANMVTGVESRLFVYPEGESRPANGGLGLSGGLDFNLGVSHWHTQQDRIPLPGKNYVVEMELTAFETDIPPQHDWDPHGKNYRVLWQRTLKQTVK